VLKHSTFLLLIFFGLVLWSKGQNIIQNGSFEDTARSGFGTLKSNHWGTPTVGSTPDFFHSSRTSTIYRVPQNYSGFQNAIDGNAYFGIMGYDLFLSETREYIKNRLLDSLKKDSTYCFQMYVSLADSMTYAIKNNLGVFFSRNNIKLNNLLHLRIDTMPQIEFNDSSHFTEKNQWVKLSGAYTAQGGERFLSIGVFKTDSLLDTLFVGGGSDVTFNKTYYYIDDVWLSHCDSLPKDSGAVGLNETPRKEQDILLYPNPVRQFFTLETQATALSNFQLINAMGQQFPLQAEKAANGFRFDAQHLPKGLYILQLGGEVPKAVKFVKK